MNRWPVSLCGALLMLGIPCIAPCDTLRPVGIVGHKLVSQANWVLPWKAEWDSGKIADIFRRDGVPAEVIGLDVIADPQRLKSYRAIMVPTDECYPDNGARNGPLSAAIAQYVRSGGVYIMAMGAAHCRYLDGKTGKVVDSYQAGERDFLGLKWVIGGQHDAPGPALAVTAEGEKAGIAKPRFTSPVSTYARAIQQPGVVYVKNEAGNPSLYASPVGKGAVIHYAGGLPLGPDVRDWLIASYAAVLKSSPDARAIVAHAKPAQIYELFPVTARSRVATGGPAVGEIVLDGDWDLAEASEASTIMAPDEEKLSWQGVKMPNTIQHALFEAGKIDNPWYADNYKKLQWIHQRDWYLRKRFTVPSDWAGRQIRLRFDGMDYCGTVWLDGDCLGLHKGMFGGPTFDLSGTVTAGAKHELLVRLNHETGPQSGPSQVIKSMAIDGTSYQWGNRFRTIGLWQPVRLIGTGQAFMEAPYVRTDSAGKDSATLWAQAMITNNGPEFQGEIAARIVDGRTGKEVWSGTTRQSVPGSVSYWEREIKLSKPKLWWPNGLGQQPLYKLELSLRGDGKELDAINCTFGIRTLKMTRNPSFPAHPRNLVSEVYHGDRLADQAITAADESYKFLFSANGRRFYAKGVSWLTSDDLLWLSPQRERWLVQAAKLHGINLFRLNGGCNIFETEQFLNLCDESGIMVWQELPFCWNTTTGASPAEWRDQITQTVLRLRQHPCLAVYVGGNEFPPYAPGTIPTVDLAHEIFSAFDNRPFRMSSPGGGTHHAYIPWEMYGADPNWYGRLVNEAYYFVSEWSFPGFANMSLLKRVVPADELSRGPVGYDWQKFLQTHPIFRDRASEVVWTACSFNKGSWYGDLAHASLADLVQYGQMAQADVYGCVFEQWRSQFPYKGGETVWTYNTLSPVSSWNLIDWFGQPTACYYSTKRADEPVHVMADCGFFNWGPGDTFKASVFALNDAASRLQCKLSARILDWNMKTVANEDWRLTVPDGGLKSQARDVFWAIPADAPEGYFFLELALTDAAGTRLSTRNYWLRVLRSLADPQARKAWQARPTTEPATTTGPWLRPQIERFPTSLEARATFESSSRAEARVNVTVRNTGSHPAFPLRLAVSPDVYPVVWSDDYFWLAPGESCMITGIVRLDLDGLDPVARPRPAALKEIAVGVSAWNVSGLITLRP